MAIPTYKVGKYTQGVLSVGWKIHTIEMRLQIFRFKILFQFVVLFFILKMGYCRFIVQLQQQK